MEDRFKIFGSEMSPYSVKVRAYFRYKRIPHQWLARRTNEEEFQKHARLPIVPLVVTPDGESLQDSTPIIEKFEESSPEPPIHPEDSDLAFLSALIEEYGDEWANKIMFHHRWHYEEDQIATAHVLSRGTLPDADRQSVEYMALRIRDRMTRRGTFVGSNDETAPLISKYLDDLLAILEPHLERRLYLFGDRPAFADFGLAAQVYQMVLDPTAGAIIRARTPNVLGWALRMQDPYECGEFESWAELRATLSPLLSNVGAFFLPWSQANADALAAGNEEFAVSLPSGVYRQQPQKYHARSLEALRSRYRLVADKTTLDEILEATNCFSYLIGGVDN